MTAYRLPLPPSANALVMPVILKGKRGPSGKPVCRLIPTKEAKAFRESAHARLPIAPVGGVLELYATFYVPTIASDCSNRIKALEDALKGRLFYDDKQVAEIHAVKVVTSDRHEIGVVVHVVPAEIGAHPEMSKRLAVSSIADQAAADEQAELEFEMESQHLAYTPREPERPVFPVAPRPVLPEPLRAKLERLATPASYPPDEPPEAA